MYFSNIADNEIAQFHGTVENNFNIPISIIQNGMFEIENIIDEKLYKVYPLFYCEGIASTNPDDVIFDNKCIILDYDSNTRLYFKSALNIAEVEVGFDSLIKYTSNYIECEDTNALFLFFDKNTNRLLEGVKVTADLVCNNVHYKDEGISNAEGLVYLPNLMNAPDKFTTGLITAEYNNQTITIWEME